MIFFKYALLYPLTFSTLVVQINRIMAGLIASIMAFLFASLFAGYLALLELRKDKKSWLRFWVALIFFMGLLYWGVVDKVYSYWASRSQNNEFSLIEICGTPDGLNPVLLPKNGDTLTFKILVCNKGNIPVRGLRDRAFSVRVDGERISATSKTFSGAYNKYSTINPGEGVPLYYNIHIGSQPTAPSYFCFKLYYTDKTKSDSITDFIDISGMRINVGLKRPDSLLAEKIDGYIQEHRLWDIK